MCCPTKENTCFFLSDRLFGCYIDGLIVLLKFSSSSAGISYAPLFVNFAIGHNPFLPLVWPPKRGREQYAERVSTNLLPATFPCTGHTSKVGFQQNDFSVLFSFDTFLSLEVAVKAALSFVEEVGAIQVVINPSPLSPTPPTCLTKAYEKYTPAYRSKPEGRLHTFHYSVFVFLSGFYTPASLHFSLIW